MKKIIFGIIILIFIIFAAFLIRNYSQQRTAKDIGNVLEKQDLIQVTAPQPNTLVSSPLKIEGKARGTWFFEASFPVRLIDANGENIPLDPPYIMATQNWMTSDFVPFEATLIFEQPTTKRGTLIFEKDNPSGLPENADEMHFPVIFSK